MPTAHVYRMQSAHGGNSAPGSGEGVRSFARQVAPNHRLQEHFEHFSALWSHDASEFTTPRSVAFHDRPIASAMLQMITEGDVLVLESMSDLGDRPTAIRSALDILNRSAADSVFCPEAGPHPIASYGSALRATLAASSAVEDQLHEQEARFKRLEQDVAAYKAKVLDQVMDRARLLWGAPSALLDAVADYEAPAEQTEASAQKTAKVAKSMAAKLGLTQDEVADLAGVSKSSAHRFFANGRMTPAGTRIMSALMQRKAANAKKEAA